MARGFTRRQFLGCVTTGAASWYFSRHFGFVDAQAEAGGSFFDAAGPIDRSLGDKAPAAFFGDQFENAHRILWDIPGYLAKHPAPTKWEQAPLVIVGGGLSGLFSAYTFRKYNPIVLEHAPRLGGNAKGQSWRGIDFGLGSAYFPRPYKGDPFHRYFVECGLDKLVQTAPEEEPVSLDRKLSAGFWKGEAEPEHRAVYAKLSKYLDGIYESEKHPFPEIPSLDAKGLATLQDLDQMTLAQALEKNVGKLPPLLAQAIDAYCWSSFAASSAEISAAAGLCFLAAEKAPLCVAPGGNAGLAEHLIRKCLSDGVASGSFRTQSTAVKVSAGSKGVRVLYAGPDGNLRGIEAKAAILACPKFVAAKILEGIEPERVSACKQIEYRSYLTAGVLVGKPLRSRYYDVFLVDKSKAVGQAPTKATDVVVGSLGQTRGRNTALTLYRPLPGATARASLMQPGAYQKLRGEFQAQIAGELLPVLGFSTSDLVDIRLARWAHALPIPKPGTFRSELPQKLRKPFGTNVFFIEQDNWLTPALETGVGEVSLQEPLILSALGKPDVARRTR